MVTRMFGKDYLKAVLYGKVGGRIEDKIVGHDRWSVEYEMVFKAPGGKTFLVSYSRGATEQQDEAPFDLDDDQIECLEVCQVEKTVPVWEPCDEPV